MKCQKTMSDLKSTCCSIFIATLLTACAVEPTSDKFYSRGFEWDSAKYTVVCAGNELDLQHYLDRIHPRILRYLSEQGILEGNEFLDFRRPTSIGYRSYHDIQYLQFEFETSLPGKDLDVLDGGVVIAVKPCVGEFIFAALLVY